MDNILKLRAPSQFDQGVSLWSKRPGDNLTELSILPHAGANTLTLEKALSYYEFKRRFEHQLAGAL